MKEKNIKNKKSKIDAVYHDREIETEEIIKKQGITVKNIYVYKSGNKQKEKT